MPRYAKGIASPIQSTMPKDVSQLWRTRLRGMPTPVTCSLFRDSRTCSTGQLREFRLKELMSCSLAYPRGEDVCEDYVVRGGKDTVWKRNLFAATRSAAGILGNTRHARR